MALEIPNLLFQYTPKFRSCRAAWTAVDNGFFAVDAVVEGCFACEKLRCDGTVLVALVDVMLMMWEWWNSTLLVALVDVLLVMWEWWNSTVLVALVHVMLVMWEWWNTTTFVALVDVLFVLLER
ncbi:hypothetical protein HAX54_004210 [Datura stramonium]|uniref:Uncharacterized protein n=1 Tax=Datura stramonium TaxID=4076 RepID=A0ABS8WSR2_DATST|nr:hypothetical protein [Datura stramonium]